MGLSSRNTFATLDIVNITIWNGTIIEKTKRQYKIYTDKGSNCALQILWKGTYNMYYEKDFDNTHNENNESDTANDKNKAVENEDSGITENKEAEKNEVIIDAGSLFEEEKPEDTDDAPDSVYLYADGNSYQNENDGSVTQGYSWNTQKDE